MFELWTNAVEQKLCVYIMNSVGTRGIFSYSAVNFLSWPAFIVFKWKIDLFIFSCFYYPFGNSCVNMFCSYCFSELYLFSFCFACPAMWMRNWRCCAQRTRLGEVVMVLFQCGSFYRNKVCIFSQKSAVCVWCLWFARNTDVDTRYYFTCWSLLHITHVTWTRLWILSLFVFQHCGNGWIPKWRRGVASFAPRRAPPMWTRPPGPTLWAGRGFKRLQQLPLSDFLRGAPRGGPSSRCPLKPTGHSSIK